MRTEPPSSAPPLVEGCGLTKYVRNPPRHPRQLVPHHPRRLPPHHRRRRPSKSHKRHPPCHVTTPNTHCVTDPACRRMFDTRRFTNGVRSSGVCCPPRFVHRTPCALPVPRRFVNRTSTGRYARSSEHPRTKHQYAGVRASAARAFRFQNALRTSRSPPLVRSRRTAQAIPSSLLHNLRTTYRETAIDRSNRWPFSTHYFGRWIVTFDASSN